MTVETGGRINIINAGRGRGWGRGGTNKGANKKQVGKFSHVMRKHFDWRYIQYFSYRWDERTPLSAVHLVNDRMPSLPRRKFFSPSTIVVLPGVERKTGGGGGGGISSKFEEGG